MFFDKPIVRMGIKCLVLLAAGLVGLFAQRNWIVALSLLVFAIILQGFDYRLSNRITTLVLERITGIMESCYHCCDFSANSHVRMAIWVPSVYGNTLRQVGRYYPTNTYSSFSRGLASSKGIVGLCYRSRQMCAEVIKQQTSFISHMISHWGFTEEEADQVRTKRSYLAIPIFDANSNILGVAYFDSMEEDTFDPIVIDILTKASVPLCKWIGL